MPADSILNHFDGLSISKQRDRRALHEPPLVLYAARVAVLHAINAVHRARQRPARESLSAGLSRSPNEVVRRIGESLGVEGYLEGRSFSRAEADVLAAEACEI